MEELDLFDKNRMPLNKKIFKGEKMPKDTYRLVVHLAIFNSKNQMLIQQRSFSCKSWTGLWDLSIGGSAIAGETSCQAIQREVQEELGLQIDFSEIRPMLTLNFSEGFDDVYVIIKDDICLQNLILQKAEVNAVKWATCEEIKQLLNKKQFIPYFKSYIDFLFERKNIYDIRKK